MKQLKIAIANAIDWFDGRASRERWILLFGSATAVYAFISLTLLNPLLQKREDLAHGLTSVQKELVELQVRAEGTAAAASDNRQAGFGERVTILERELARLGGALEKERAGLVPPHEARRVLEELLSQESGLELVRLEALAPTPFYAEDDPSEADGAGATQVTPEEDRQILYRHDLRLVATGEYFSALRYLAALEGGSHGIVLDELEYEVEEHPRARIVVQVYTLSFDRSWIGV